MSLSSWLRIGGIAGAVLAFFGLIWFAAHRFTEWKDKLYQTGYTSGVTDTNLKWQTASNKALSQQYLQATTDAAGQRAAVQDYLTTLQSLVPSLQALDKRRTEYVASPAGTAPCLDADGVRLIVDQRKALGLGGSVASGKAATPTP